MYDLNGNPIRGYDIGGNPHSDASQSDAGIVRNHTKTNGSPPTSYGTNITDSYNSFKASLRNHPTAIPFFVISDQHGVGLDLLRYINDFDFKDKINFLKFQLGDYCYDYFTRSAMSNLLKESIGINGYISVPGNHDYKNSGNEFDADILRKSFTQDVSWFACRFSTSAQKCYTAIDFEHDIKMIVVDPYDANGFISGMAHPWYNTETVNWLIQELTNDEGRDILYIQHEPITATSRSRDGKSETDYANPTALRIRPLILARKNKEQGTYTDTDGVSHSYDFRNCKGELILSLHGHRHAEYLSTNVLTSYTCVNGYGGTFGLIDRYEGLLRVWRFSYDAKYDELDVPLVGVGKNVRMVEDPFMTFEDKNELNFIFNIPSSEVNDTVVVINDETYPASEAEPYNGYFRFRYGIYTSKMRDSIVVKIQSNNAYKAFAVGDSMVESYTTTAEAYFNRVRETEAEDSAYLKFINAYDTLGKYYQIQSNYNADNIGTVDEQEAIDVSTLDPYRTTASGSATGFTLTNMSLNITDTIRLTCMASFTGYSTIDYTITMDGKLITEFGTMSSMTTFRGGPIPIANYGTPIAISITNNSVGDTMTVGYSVISFVRAALRNGSDTNLNNLCTAIYWAFKAYKEYQATL